MGDKAQFTFIGFIWRLVENGVSPVVGGEEQELGAQSEAPGRDDTGLAWAVEALGQRGFKKRCDSRAMSPAAGTPER